MKRKVLLVVMAGAFFAGQTTLLATREIGEHKKKEQQKKQFIAAIQNGDLETIKNLKKEGFDVKSDIRFRFWFLGSKRTMNGLHLAVRIAVNKSEEEIAKVYVPIIKYLVKKDVKRYAKDSDHTGKEDQKSKTPGEYLHDYAIKNLALKKLDVISKALGIKPDATVRRNIEALLEK